MASKPIRPTKKFEKPKDIRFQVYTNAEILSILGMYNAQFDNAIRDNVSTENINTMLKLLDRMKFLIAQIKQGKP